MCICVIALLTEFQLATYKYEIINYTCSSVQSWSTRMTQSTSLIKQFVVEVRLEQLALRWSKQAVTELKWSCIILPKLSGMQDQVSIPSPVQSWWYHSIVLYRYMRYVYCFPCHYSWLLVSYTQSNTTHAMNIDNHYKLVLWLRMWRY